MDLNHWPTEQNIYSFFKQTHTTAKKNIKISVYVFKGKMTMLVSKDDPDNLSFCCQYFQIVFDTFLL